MIQAAWIALYVIIFLAVACKIYLWWTTGICTSNRRMIGKTVIVTGANTGIGYETAKDLAARGARVILACRNLEKARIACEKIILETGNTNVVVRILDLSSLKSVREFAAEILKTEPRLDVLINNAGVGAITRKILTADGLEYHMATNHFGPFLLTNLLLGLLQKSAPSRIVVVSSLVHRFAKLQLDNLNAERIYDTSNVYLKSKLANVLFTRELANRLDETGITVNCLHPGAIVTELLRHAPIYVKVLQAIITPFMKTPKEGAQTSIYLAVSEDVEGVTGKYFSDCKEATISSTAKDEALARKLWDISERLVGLVPKETHL